MIHSAARRRVAAWTSPPPARTQSRLIYPNPMLRYMNAGTRSGPSAHPLGVQRGNWEFLAVVRGAIRPVFPGEAAATFRSRRLWLLPPESPHSWITPPGRCCDVFVFHFALIHPLLESSLPAIRRLSIPVIDADEDMFSALQRELLPHYRSPQRASAMHFESAMLRLCSLFIARDRSMADLVAFDGPAATLQRALQWHRDHLTEGIAVKDVATALHISPSQLRRIFMRLRGESPKRVLTQATLAEACRLMAQTALSLKEVAGRCGFRGFSEFYRAFKRHTGQSPSFWRRNQLYGEVGFAPSPRTRRAGAGSPERLSPRRTEEPATAVSIG